MEKIKDLAKKILTKEVIMYIIFGILTTLVNLVISFLLEGVFNVDGAIASAIGIIASVLFAYFTNRKMVFNTTAKGFKENFNEFIKFSLLSFIIGAEIIFILSFLFNLFLKNK